MTWLLILLLYAPDASVPTRVERAFPTQALCVAERDHLWTQHREQTGGLIAWCEGR